MKLKRVRLSGKTKRTFRQGPHVKLEHVRIVEPNDVVEAHDQGHGEREKIELPRPRGFLKKLWRRMVRWTS